MITREHAEHAVKVLEQYMAEQSAQNPPVDEEGQPCKYYTWSQDTPHIDYANAWAKRILRASRKDNCSGCILCCS